MVTIYTAKQGFWHECLQILHYSSLGSRILTLHGVKYLLFVPCENPKDYNRLVNAYIFGGVSQVGKTEAGDTYCQISASTHLILWVFHL